MQRAKVGRWLAGGLVILACVTGCGRGSGRFQEYPFGKINLDQVTCITPRIRIGLDEFPLNEEGIDQVVHQLKKGEYGCFQVEASILFDEFRWVVYQSEMFDRAKAPLAPRDLHEIERRLRAARKIYRNL